MSDVIPLRTRVPRQRHWTSQEEEYLRANYRRVPVNDLASALGRSPRSICTKADRGGFTRHPRWTTAEDEHLRSRYGQASAAEIGRELGRPEKSIYWRAMKLGLTRSTEVWSPKEDALLEELYGTMTAADVASRIGRTRKAVRHRARALGLSQRIPQETMNLIWAMRDDATPGFFAAQLHIPVRAVERALGAMQAAGGPPPIPQPTAR